VIVEAATRLSPVTVRWARPDPSVHRFDGTVAYLLGGHHMRLSGTCPLTIAGGYRLRLNKDTGRFGTIPLYGDPTGIVGHVLTRVCASNLVRRPYCQELDPHTRYISCIDNIVVDRWTITFCCEVPVNDRDTRDVMAAGVRTAGYPAYHQGVVNDRFEWVL
jgi:hypothetical protein